MDIGNAKHRDCAIYDAHCLDGGDVGVRQAQIPCNSRRGGDTDLLYRNAAKNELTRTRDRRVMIERYPHASNERMAASQKLDGLIDVQGAAGVIAAKGQRVQDHLSTMRSRSSNC